MLSQMTVAENLMFERLPQRSAGELPRDEPARGRAPGGGRARVAPTTLVSRLDVAQMQLVEIAKMLWLREQLLILDEPTPALDREGGRPAVRHPARLKARGVTILYISTVSRRSARSATA